MTFSVDFLGLFGGFLVKLDLVNFGGNLGEPKGRELTSLGKGLKVFLDFIGEPQRCDSGVGRLAV